MPSCNMPRNLLSLNITAVALHDLKTVSLENDYLAVGNFGKTIVLQCLCKRDIFVK